MFCENKLSFFMPFDVFYLNLLIDLLIFCVDIIYYRLNLVQRYCTSTPQCLFILSPDNFKMASSVILK